MSYKNNRIPTHVLGNSNILPQSKANKSVFNLSEDLKTTIQFDKLIPVYWEELNPGDTFDVSVKTLARLMPMVAPTMSNIKLKYFSFFVPNRLLWKNWTKFMGEKVYQDEHTDYVVPEINIVGEDMSVPNWEPKISDYLGVPVIPRGKSINVSALPFRAYNKIYNEWFRAKEVQPLFPEYSGDTSTEETLDKYILLRKGKPADYFTSCLPYPQSGEPVTIPLTGNAPVMGTSEPTFLTGTESGIGSQTQILSLQGRKVGDSVVVNGTDRITGDYDTHMYADMSSVTGVSIEMLRKASALQVLLEKDARAGESYIELMNVHYGTSVPDFLVGRSQYLGSSHVMLNVEPIAQTGGTQSDSPQGNLAGVGIGVNGDKLCELSAVEHGIFMIVACVDGEVSYSQGLPRKFSKSARYDYMFPEFHNLGDQSVLNKELFVTGNPAIDDIVFGYQERYRELRESTNKVSGLMRHGVPGSLDVWHLGQNFANTPSLDTKFIVNYTPIERVMAVPSEHQVILNCYFDIKATRILPVSSNPSLLAGRV